MRNRPWAFVGLAVLSGVCVFKSGLSTPIRVSLIVVPDSSPRGFGRVMGFGQTVISAISPLTRLVKVVHLLGVPERGPGRCDNTSVGVVCLWGEYFEERALLFVCLKDKACPRAEGGPRRRWRLLLGSWCSRRAVPRFRALAPGFLGCFVARRSRAAGLSRCCAA